MAPTAMLGKAQKPGARNSIRISHRGGKSPSTWSVLDCFSRSINSELDRKQSTGNHGTPIWYVSVASGSLTCFTTTLGPE